MICILILSTIGITEKIKSEKGYSVCKRYWMRDKKQSREIKYKAITICLVRKEDILDRGGESGRH